MFLNQNDDYYLHLEYQETEDETGLDYSIKSDLSIY